MAKRINSRAKGARGEREFAKFLKSFGIEARRGQQFSGSSDSPDVVHNLPDTHFEVKRTERLSVYKAMAQATKDAGGKLPIVAHKANGKDWLAILPMDDLIAILLAHYMSL